MPVETAPDSRADLRTLREELEKELDLSARLIELAQGWVPALRARISQQVRQGDALPGAASFFALWSFHLLESIHTLARSELYGGALLLLRSLIEAHMELSFILHRDGGERAAEYLAASRENRPPYRNHPALSSFDSLGKRAGSCGLGELYRKTYLSLSFYSHLRVKGSLASDPNSEKSLIEAAACLVVGGAMLAKIGRQLSRAFHFPMPQSLAKASADALRRYKELISRQEEWIRSRKQKDQAPAA